jgi:DNA ligase-1
MGPPSKKRKINGDLKSSPSSTRSLDFFFGKQKQKPIAEPLAIAKSALGAVPDVELTDEELARKLQAEWDQEAGNGQPKEEEAGHSEQSGNNIVPETDRENEPTTVQLGSTIASSIDQSQNKNDEINPSATRAMLLPTKNTLSLQSTGTAEDTITANIPFDESTLVFEPSKYIHELQRHWAGEGGNATYALLTRCFVLVNSTQSRIKIVDTLVNLLRTIIEGDPSSLLPTVSYTSSSKVLGGRSNTIGFLTRPRYRYGLLPMQSHHHIFL